MNKVILMGRLVRDPEVRYSTGNNAIATARYRLAVDRRFKRNNEEQNVDYISCVAFGKSAEFAERYLRQGTKILVTGRIQTGSYTNRDGQTIHTVDVVIEDQEFTESKNAGKADGKNNGTATAPPSSTANAQTAPVAPAEAYSEEEMGGFMHIPEGYDEELPFN